MDLDAGSEFLFGPDLLVAPPPHPDELDTYEVRLPPVTWYDYWTGEKIERPASNATQDHAEAAEAKNPGRALATKSLIIHPKLDVLPVYVREGSILPMQPVTQSTMETPRGPLTLRVYPGRTCKGSLYLDDGVSFAYTRGDFLRVDFSCEVTGHSVRLHIGSRQGSYPAWWKDLSVEIYGTETAPQRIQVNGKPGTSHRPSFDASRHCVDITVPDDGQAQDITIEAEDRTRGAQ